MTPDKTLQLIFSAGAIVLLAFCLVAIVFVPIPDKQLNLFTALASGVVGSTFGAIGGFLFGSSIGSHAKDAALIEQAKS